MSGKGCRTSDFGFASLGRDCESGKGPWDGTVKRGPIFTEMGQVLDEGARRVMRRDGRFRAYNLVGTERVSWARIAACHCRGVIAGHCSGDRGRCRPDGADILQRPCGHR
jgi:hypothetical protein